MRAPILETSASQRSAEEHARQAYPELVGIVHKRFAQGVAEVFADAFREERFPAFGRKADPVYSTLLAGMNDEGIARDLVEKWMISQTMLTQSRFWLEDVIVDVLWLQWSSIPDLDQRPQIYSLSMLRSGWYGSPTSLWNVGENWRAHVVGRGQWTQRIGLKALAAAEAAVSQQEARFDAVMERREAGHDVAAHLTPEQDRAAFARVHDALGGDHRATALKCNLLVIEPETDVTPGRVTGIRALRLVLIWRSDATTCRRLLRVGQLASLPRKESRMKIATAADASIQASGT